MNPCTVTVNPDYTSVQNAVAAAADGDVICLNAGSVTYTSSLDISAGGAKGLEIRGAGALPSPWGSAGQTVIYTNSGSAAFVWHASANHSMVISNIRFTFDEHAAPINYGILTAGGDAGKPYIVHHCDFLVTGTCNCTSINAGTNAGIIYRNKFSADVIVGGSCNSTATNMDALKLVLSDDGAIWSTASTFGTADTLGNKNTYFETNYLRNQQVAADFDTSSRLIWRFNEMHNSSTGGHGFDSSPTGPRLFELYNNTYLCDEAFWVPDWFASRGGTGLFFNNSFAQFAVGLCGTAGGFDSTAAPSLHFIQYNCFACDFGAGWPGSYPNTYPSSHQIGWGWISGSNQNVGSSSAQHMPGGSGFDQALEPMYCFNNTNLTGNALVGINHGRLGACRLMTYSNSSKSSGTTLVIPASGPSNYPIPYANVGQEAVVVFVDLIGGTAPSIASSPSHTWTALQGGTNGSMRLSAWRTTVTTNGQMTVTITHDSSSAARAGTLSFMRGLTVSPLDKNPSVVTDNVSPYTAPATGTLASSTEIVLGYFALNGPTVWQSTRPTTYVSDTLGFGSEEQSVACGECGMNFTGVQATTGGADNTNVTVMVTHRTVSSTSSVAPSVTNSTANRNGIAGSVSFKVDGPTTSGSDCPLDLQTTDFVKFDREIYDDKVGTFNGTSGTGSGSRIFRPSTCTTGVAYWSTDQGSWNTSGSGGQGVLDKCTATNTWTNAWYTPYSYPHPLATESGGGGISVTDSIALADSSSLSVIGVAHAGLTITDSSSIAVIGVAGGGGLTIRDTADTNLRSFIRVTG